MPSSDQSDSPGRLPQVEVFAEESDSPKVYDLSKPPVAYEYRIEAGAHWLVPVYEPEPLTEDEARILRDLESRS